MLRFLGLGGGSNEATSISPKSRSDSGNADKKGKKKQNATDLIDYAFNAEELLDEKPMNKTNM